MNGYTSAAWCRAACSRNGACVAYFYYHGYRKDCYHWFNRFEVKGGGNKAMSSCMIKVPPVTVSQGFCVNSKTNGRNFSKYHFQGARVPFKNCMLACRRRNICVSFHWRKDGQCGIYDRDYAPYKGQGWAGFHCYTFDDRDSRDWN